MAEEFQAAVYGGSWWISPTTACNHSSYSSDIITDMENLGPFWPKNLMQDTQKPIIDWNLNLLSSRVQEEMNTFSTTGDDGLAAEIEAADHQVLNMDQQQSLDFTTTTFPIGSTTSYGYPLSLVQSLFINNSPSPPPPPPPPPPEHQSLYEYQSNSKNLCFTRNLTNINPTDFKRPRLETPSPLPSFKVRKEKLGDRITALQQLVSPFGKTDTASVLHEAIEYIKLLHDQVNILSAPYMKRVTKEYQPIHDNVKDEERQIQDLRGQGLCLVPVSGMFPVATEMATDFWTPSYEG